MKKSENENITIEAIEALGFVKEKCSKNFHLNWIFEYKVENYDKDNKHYISNIKFLIHKDEMFPELNRFDIQHFGKSGNMKPLTNLNQILPFIIESAEILTKRNTKAEFKNWLDS